MFRWHKDSTGLVGGWECIPRRWVAPVGNSAPGHLRSENANLNSRFREQQQGRCRVGISPSEEITKPPPPVVRVALWPKLGASGAGNGTGRPVVRAAGVAGGQRRLDCAFGEWIRATAGASLGGGVQLVLQRNDDCVDAPVVASVRRGVAVESAQQNTPKSCGPPKKCRTSLAGRSYVGFKAQNLGRGDPAIRLRLRCGNPSV